MYRGDVPLSFCLLGSAPCESITWRRGSHPFSAARNKTVSLSGPSSSGFNFPVFNNSSAISAPVSPFGPQANNKSIVMSGEDELNNFLTKLNTPFSTADFKYKVACSSDEEEEEEEEEEDDDEEDDEEPSSDSKVAPRAISACFCMIHSNVTAGTLCFKRDTSTVAILYETILPAVLKNRLRTTSLKS
mmetsp:Transcript_31977/g.50070  ORF Transcript_31977/g.50070 Transcript_31977/m.50070 type:complete len:188 (-) Transcript_31977:2310-2873(-)